MFKKALSLVVSLMLMVTSLSFAAISVSAADTTYVVAGVEELCGVLWKGSPEEAPANVMTDNGDGTYTKVFTNVQPASGLTLKVVENGADGSQNWIGDATGNNITFNVTAASDVTVKFDSSTKEITVTGDGVQFVTNLDIDSINAVGNGDPEEDEAWLNGAAWDPTANPMTEVSKKVYEITFKNVSKFDNYQVKFAANGKWTDSWGAAALNFTPESGVEFDAAYNGENLTVNVPYEFADVTLKLDLTNFDYATKLGAKATVTVTEVSTPAETTEVATTEATTAPATQATAAPEKAPLTVNATSNVFSTAKAEYNSKTNQVTVCYYLGTNCDLVNLEWYFTYDSNIFKVDNKNNLDSTGKKLGIMPQITSSSVINTSIPGKVNANSSDLGLYTIDAKVPFIKIVLDVKGNPENVETNVNLNVRVLTKGEMDFNTMRVDPDTMVSFVLEYKIVDPSYIVSAETKLTESTFVPSTESTEATETTVPETTVPETTVPETTVPETTVEETTVPETTVPETTVEETTVPETTEEVPVGTLTVNATSNLFPASSNVVAGYEEYVTVTYYFESEKNVLNADFNLSYNPQMLAVDSVMTPYTNGVVVNAETAGVVYGNMSSLELYNFNQKTPFVSVVFKKLGLGETDVNLTVDNLTLSLANAEGVTDEAQEEGLVRDGVLAQTSTTYSVKTEIQAGKVTPVVPTTAEPTTPEPTTAPAPAGSTYVVAGSEELCGVLWKGSPEEAPENVMTDNGDGTYTKVFTDVQIADSLQIKVVENTADGGQNWIGDNGGDNNITFNVVAACDVTVTYDSNTRKITVSGDGVQIVSDIEIKSMHAVGNGDPDEESWLNGVAWDPTANEMEQVADKVYEITYHNVPEFDNYMVKFAANGKWADSWGGAEKNFTPESGVAFDAVYNGQDLTVNVPYEFADVTLRIDLSNFNYATKLGAVATVTVTEASQVPSTVPTSTVPTTTDPATTVPTSTVPATTIAQNTTTPNTTLAPATEDATSSTGATVKPGTADTANNGNNGNSTANNNNGTVKTGNASMAAVILLVLLSATGVVYFTRKKVK